MNARRKLLSLLAALCFLAPLTLPADSTNTLVWKAGKVDADVRNMSLQNVLEAVAHRSGWQVFAEPGLDYSASAKFKGFTPGDALRTLLGNLNFALVPQSNNVTRLFVFRTDRQAATREILARDATSAAKQGKRVPNELIVRFKSKADAERWATLLGAKITGSIPELNAYRLEFADAEAAESAREQMSKNPNVLGVEYNYYVDQPNPASELNGNVNRPFTLKPKPSANGGVVIGLIDTGVQSLGTDQDAFLQKKISVAGEASLDPSSPSHGTSMYKTVLDGIQAATPPGGSTPTVVAVDVYGANPSTTSFDVARGIYAAVNEGANVLNLSLGGSTDSAVLHEAIASASRQGIPVYAAAGNEPVNTPFYPAAYPEVTAVTAVESISGQQPRIASYANYGSFVDVAAPDGNIVYFNGKPYYVRGTSAATAYMTGIASAGVAASGRSWSDVNGIIRAKFAVPRRN